MKKYLCALMALALCLSAALAEGQPAPEEVESAPAAEESAPESAPKPEPEPAPKAEPKPEPKAEPEPEPEPAPEAAPSTETESPEPKEAEGEVAQEHPDAPEGEPEPQPGAPAEGQEGDPGAEKEPSPEGGDGAASPEGGASGQPEPQPGGEGEADGPEGYVLVEGVPRAGALKELLAEPGEKTVYLLAEKPVEIEDFALALLKKVTLLPDPERFPGENWAVKLRCGEEEILPEAIEAAGEETLVKIRFSVEELPAEPGAEVTPPPVGPGETEEPGQPGEMKLSVAALNYIAGEWMNWSPEFLLSVAPQSPEGYTFVAIVYDERFIPLSEDSYLPLEEGIYALRFAVLDPAGDVVGASERYEMMLDLTAPVLSVEVSASRDYTMTLRASDVPGSTTFPLGGGLEPQVSGVAEFSLDGGESWAPLGEGESVVHTESRRKVFPPRSILVRDLAGNVAANVEEIVLDKLPAPPDYGGWGGSGGGGGSSTPTVPHASGDGDDAPYDSYELALPDGAVDVLTLGGEEIDLGLQIEGEEAGRFTVELTSWTRAPEAGALGEAEDEEAEPPKDTLVLRAEPEAGEEAEPEAAEGEARPGRTYTWRINGAVLRKLYNSDIQYLLLQADDAAISLPTVGFTAGTRYAELKMGGVSTSEFVYEIVMRVDPEAAPEGAWNLSSDCEAEIWVEVAGERFQLRERDETPEMYSYDVYCGPEDLPDYPYGAYPVMDAAAMELDRQARLALAEAEHEQKGPGETEG